MPGYSFFSFSPSLFSYFFGTECLIWIFRLIVFHLQHQFGADREKKSAHYSIEFVFNHSNWCNPMEMPTAFNSVYHRRSNWHFTHATFKLLSHHLNTGDLLAKRNWFEWLSEKKKDLLQYKLIRAKYSVIAIWITENWQKLYQFLFSRFFKLYFFSVERFKSSLSQTKTLIIEQCWMGIALFIAIFRAIQFKIAQLIIGVWFLFSSVHSGWSTKFRF